MYGKYAYAAAMIAGIVNGQPVMPNQTSLESALQKAFPAHVIQMQEGQQGKATPVVLVSRSGGGAEKVEVSHLLSINLAGETTIHAFSLSMADRLKTIREAINRQQFGIHAESSYLLVASETRGEIHDVRKICAAVSNEASGSYVEYEELAILGPDRKQLGVTYLSCFQDEESIGMRKTKIIFDLPSAKEIYRAVIGEASSAVSGQKREWSLSYHKSPNSAAMQIHRVNAGGDDIEIYEFNETAFVLSGTEHRSSPLFPAPFKDLAESYRRGMEWPGTSTRIIDSLPRQQILMTEAVIFDDLSNEELMRIVKAAYPESRLISMIGLKMKPSRWGDQTNWTGEVEFKIEDAGSSKKECFLVWPARSVMTNGVVLLSGLVLPNQRGSKNFREASRMRMARKETVEAVFACVRIDPQGGETGYRDVIADGVYGIDEARGSRGGFYVEPGLGIFREVATHVIRAGRPPTGNEGYPIEEDWLHIYELVGQRLVLRVAHKVNCGLTTIFSASGNPQWKDVDGDGIAEVILKDTEDSAYIYKWEHGAYAFYKHSKIEPDAQTYRPRGLNPLVKFEIHVKDENGMPVDACEIAIEITTKHQNVLDLYAGPTVKYTQQVMKSDSNGIAPFEGKAFIVTVGVTKLGYYEEKVQLRPFAEPIPNILNILLRRELKENTGKEVIIN